MLAAGETRETFQIYDENMRRRATQKSSCDRGGGVKKAMSHGIFSGWPLTGRDQPLSEGLLVPEGLLSRKPHEFLHLQAGILELSLTERYDLRKNLSCF